MLVGLGGCTELAIGALGGGSIFISEGVGDIISAISGAYFRNFTWETYAFQKSISLTISIATAGFSKLWTGIKGASSEASFFKTAWESVDD